MYFVVYGDVVCVCFWYEEGYVDVGQIYEIEQVFVVGQNFVGLCDVVLYVGIVWGCQGVVIDICFDVQYGGVGCFDGGIGIGYLCMGG